MKCGKGRSITASLLRSQAGSSTYTFLGFAILAIIVVCAVAFFPWNQVFQGKKDPDMIAANDALAKKQWDKAVSLFDKAIKSNPSNSEAYVGRSRAYMQQGNIVKALEDADTAVAKGSDSAKAYGQRGIVKKLSQKPDDALKDFNEAIRLDGSYSWALAQRADLYSRKNQQEKALQDINKALQSKTNFPEGYRLRAWVLSRMGKCKQAGEDFKKVESLSPNDAWSIQDRAWFLLTCPDESLQDPTKALELAKKAAELSEGKDGVVQETLAEAYFRQGDSLTAAMHQKKAIELGSQKCPDGSCLKEMQQRLQKYEMASRPEVRISYEILPVESGN